MNCMICLVGFLLICLVVIVPVLYCIIAIKYCDSIKEVACKDCKYYYKEGDFAFCKRIKKRSFDVVDGESFYYSSANDERRRYNEILHSNKREHCGPKGIHFEKRKEAT